jgi:NAD(P)-dependent dehydrogenase (short-subunit alcohol dehydrogenase family)
MRSVLITGTSSGFGLLAAVELARRGWRVFATMRSLERKGPLAAALDAAGVRDKVEISRLDVTNGASVREAVAATLLATGGRLDAVVHNAGVAAGGAFEDIPDADVRRVLETNFFGVLDLTRVLLPTFRAQRAGRILIVSSEAAFMGQPANSIYCASKWAIEGWAEAICHELDPFGIEVVLVEPGPYVTGIWQNSPRISPEGSPYRQWVQYVFRAGEAHLQKRGGDAQDVAVAMAEVLEAPRPAFRNPVGRVARIAHFLRGKVPSALLRRTVARYLGLDRMRP